MDHCMKDTGMLINLNTEEELYIKMETIMKVISKMDYIMDMELKIFQMEEDLKVHGKLVTNMVIIFLINFQMEMYTKANRSIIGWKDLEQ